MFEDVGPYTITILLYMFKHPFEIMSQIVIIQAHAFYNEKVLAGAFCKVKPPVCIFSEFLNNIVKHR